MSYIYEMKRNYRDKIVTMLAKCKYPGHYPRISFVEMHRVEATIVFAIVLYSGPATSRIILISFV